MRAKKETTYEATGTDRPDRVVVWRSIRLLSSPRRSGGPVGLFDQGFEANPAVRDVVFAGGFALNGLAVLVAGGREPRLFEAIDLGHASFVDDDLDGAEAKVFHLLPDHFQPVGRRRDLRLGTIIGFGVHRSGR